MTTKVVVIGPIRGQFDVFTKLRKLHAKNDFSLAVVIGDLFANPEESTNDEQDSLNSLLKGEIDVPIPTYFTLGTFCLPEGVERKLEQDANQVCPNLIFLGKRSTTKTIDGTRIAALGGLLKEAVSASEQSPWTPSYTENDAASLRGAHKVDILVTSQWPSGIRSYSTITATDSTVDPPSEQCIADLCAAIKPRYHFCATAPFFYEREPFIHPNDTEDSNSPTLTRFINLAAVGNTQKQKWLYAFSIDRSTVFSEAVLKSATQNPLITQNRKRPRQENQSVSFQRFSHDQNNSHHNHRSRKRAKGPPPGPQDCFFCLSNPNIEAHLIASIGDESYLAAAKGPLPTAKAYPELAFPAHILIIPLSHSATATQIAPPETKVSTLAEMYRYRNALRAMLQVRATGKLGAITWEISRSEGIHLHWQMMPVSAELVEKGLIEAAFKVEAENQKFPKMKVLQDNENVDHFGDFLRIWIWQPQLADPEDDKENRAGDEKVLIMPLTSNDKFDLQYPRKVMAKLLDRQDRYNWRDCVQDEQEERAETEALKSAFKSYDFTLEEDT